MTQEDKELLLKDLSARLPYGVKIHINSPIEEQNSMELFDVNLDSEHIGVGNEKWVFRAIPIIDDEDKIKVIKPYLRPISSMTEEENKEYFSIWTGSIRGDMIAKIDFYIKHHFDFRLTSEGLSMIEAGLALEAPEGMYK